MQTKICPFRAGSAGGFTLAEALIATAIVGISFLSLYAGLIQGNKIIADSQHDMRATELMAQQMETIRLYTWDQLTNSGYIPLNNTISFYPTSMTNQVQGTGISYYESLTVTNSGLTEGYSNDLKEVIVSLLWTNQSGPHQRQMTTLVSHYGIQNYIYTGN